MTSMTPKQRVLAALRGEPIDFVPFTAYVNSPVNLFPRGQTERMLRNNGVAMVDWYYVHQIAYRNVSIVHKEYWEDGRKWIRNTLSTPVGDIWETHRTGGGYGSTLRCEFFIKRPEDYKVMEYAVRDAVFTPNNEAMLEAEKCLGEDGVVFAYLDYSPLQEMLILLMGPEQFSVDLLEGRKEFFSLYEAMCERHRELYEIAAGCPAPVVIYGDNITSDMIGVDRFVRYVAPCYNEMAEKIHPRGKLLGVHMDGNLRVLREAIARTSVDIIEAYTPPPDFDLPVKEARAAWPDKVLWLNFPSSVHLSPSTDIRATTRELLEQARPGKQFLVGITENVPDTVWQKSYSTICQTLREYGPVPQ